MSILTQIPICQLNVPEDAAEAVSDPVPGRSPERLFANWGGPIHMLFTIGVGMIGLGCFASHMSTQNPGLAPADQPGAGIVLWSEILDIWLPPALIELAKRQPHSGEVLTHEELRRLLEVRGQERLWYALTIRGYQVAGGHADLTFVRQPHVDPGHFFELLTILAAAAGNPPVDAAEGLSTAALHILPQELLRREPREVMVELLGFRNTAADREPTSDCTITSLRQ
jgi:hypothetical protein